MRNLTLLAVIGAFIVSAGCESLPKKSDPEKANRDYGSYSWWNNRMNESRNGRDIKGSFGSSGEGIADYGQAEESGFEF